MQTSETTVVLLHATMIKNLASIKKRGLLPGKAVRNRKAVWLASESEEQWAVKHCVQNRACSPDEVCIIRVEVPVSWIRGFRYGLWYCGHVIPPACLRSVKRYVAVEEVLG